MENSNCQFFSSHVPAGFASVVNDASDGPLNLHNLMVTHPESTFFVRAHGDSMIGAGIFSGDILVIDRSIKAVSGMIILAVVDTEFTIKRLKIEKDQVFLIAENPHYSPITISKEQEFSVWGVVTYAVHKILPTR